MEKIKETYFFCQISVVTFFVLIEIGPPIAQYFGYGSAQKNAEYYKLTKSSVFKSVCLPIFQIWITFTYNGTMPFAED